VPYLSLAPLRNAGARLDAAARDYAGALGRSGATPEGARGAVDAILMKTERALTREDGLEGRPWFRHLVYAPGFYTGYGVKTLPAVREAIEQRQWDRVDAGVAATAAVLEACASEIEKASRALGGPPPRP
jgi:N-acetylated-alpha-linked acidic dipeptidase